jgi:WD40 repeat protein
MSSKLKVKVTFYGYPDNDDGENNFGTNIIAHTLPGRYTNEDGAPIAGGEGTYDDPITAATKDGQLIASCSEDKTVKLWSLDGRELQVFQGHQDKVLGLSFSPDGQVIVSFSKDKTVRLWSRNSREMQVLQGHDECILGVSFSPDSQTLTSVSVDGIVKFWNFDLEDLLVCGCNWVQDYLKTNPNVSESDRTLCDGIAGFSPASFQLD